MQLNSSDPHLKLTIQHEFYPVGSTVFGSVIYEGGSSSSTGGTAEAWVDNNIQAVTFEDEVFSLYFLKSGIFEIKAEKEGFLPSESVFIKIS